MRKRAFGSFRPGQIQTTYRADLRLCCSHMAKTGFHMTWLNCLLTILNYYLSISMTKPTKWPVCPTKTQTSLTSTQSDRSLLSACGNLGSLVYHQAHSKESDLIFCWFCLAVDHLSRDMTKPTKWLCAQRRLRSAWASVQSDQSLRCVLNR